VVSEEDFSELSKIAKCPICGGELEKGYAIVSKSMWWDTEKHDFRGGEERLTDYPVLANTNFPALRCTRCYIVILNNK
jgi:hypothetical protein